MKNYLLIASLISCFFGSYLYAQNTVRPEASNKVDGWWQAPGGEFKLRFGGYVKADFIYDFKPIGSPSFFDVTQIPTDQSEGQAARFQAMETRLNIDVRKATELGEIRAFVEGDFYGSGNSFRLRHAYVSLGKHWLAGQSWSTFTDVNIIPPTLDFEKPAAYAFARHAQLRYTTAISPKWEWSLAVEDPSKAIVLPTEGSVETPMPDLVTRFVWTSGRTQIFLAGFYARARFLPDSGKIQNVEAYGVNTSFSMGVSNKNRVFGQAIYGPGISRQRFGNFAEPDSDGQIKPLLGFGLNLGYEHFWSEKWSSLFLLSHGGEHLEFSDNTDLISQNTYAAVNLLWHLPAHSLVGLEYLYGNRTDINDLSGDAHRLMMSLKTDL